MDLGDYQHVKDHNEPDLDIEECRAFVERSIARLEIERNPAPLQIHSSLVS